MNVIRCSSSDCFSIRRCSLGSHIPLSCRVSLGSLPLNLKQPLSLLSTLDTFGEYRLLCGTVSAAVCLSAGRHGGFVSCSSIPAVTSSDHSWRHVTSAIIGDVSFDHLFLISSPSPQYSCQFSFCNSEYFLRSQIICKLLFSFIKKVIMLENTDKREEDTWVFNFLVPYTDV